MSELFDNRNKCLLLRTERTDGTQSRVPFFERVDNNFLTLGRSSRDVDIRGRTHVPMSRVKFGFDTFYFASQNVQDIHELRVFLIVRSLFKCVVVLELEKVHTKLFLIRRIVPWSNGDKIGRKSKEMFFLIPFNIFN